MSDRVSLIDRGHGRVVQQLDDGFTRKRLERAPGKRRLA